MNFSFHQTNTKPWISPRYREPTRALYIPLDQTQCTTFRWRGTHHNGLNLHALSSRARHGDVVCIIILMMLSCSCWGLGFWSLGCWSWPLAVVVSWPRLYCGRGVQCGYCDRDLEDVGFGFLVPVGVGEFFFLSNQYQTVDMPFVQKAHWSPILLDHTQCMICE